MKKIKTMTMKGKRILMYLMLCVCFISASGTNVSIDGPQAKPKAFYERMLEAFCVQCYDELFEDFWGSRQYVKGSLKVKSMRIGGQREVILFGSHQFQGRLGFPTYNQRFKVNIYESKKTPNEYVITFEKESEYLATGRTYIESRTKTFHYEE